MYTYILTALTNFYVTIIFFMNIQNREIRIRKQFNFI